MGPLEWLSAALGLHLPALMIFVTGLAGYPIAYVYREYGQHKMQPVAVKHAYFFSTGLLLGVWNYGWGMGHCLAAVLVCYVLLLALGPSKAGVVAVFTFIFSYLWAGYIWTSTDGYDITWTMPFCVLVLRQIGVAYDLYDGARPEAELSSENLKNRLTQMPSLLEVYGHALFPTTFMIGPQFSMRRYQALVRGDLFPDGKLPENNSKAAILRLLFGVGYLLVNQAGTSLIITDDYLLTDEFGSLSLWKRLLYMGLWGKFTMYKYISIWLIYEGSTILTGLAYDGKDANGKALWSGVSNVKPATFEAATEFNHYIQSFNTNTNYWCAEYVFKRCKSLNNRYISQGLTLLFLAMWHGYHSGYYVTFFCEFIIMFMEKDIKSIVSKYPSYLAFIERNYIRQALFVLQRLYTFVFMGWCLYGLVFLSADKYWKAFRNVDFVFVVLFVPWAFVYRPVFKAMLNRCFSESGKKSD